MEPVDWDRRYREGFYNGATDAHLLLQRFWKVIPRGPVADIAMGNGRNSRFLAGHGYETYGVDRSSEALKIARDSSAPRILPPGLILGDANNLPFRKESMTGVIIFYFLLRNIMAELVGLLRTGGVLMYETFLKRQNAVDRYRNPDFLLDDGELIGYFGDLDLIFYEETLSSTGGKTRALARFVGRRK
jgi:tellurite methyltransferase